MKITQSLRNLLHCLTWQKKWRICIRLQKTAQFWFEQIKNTHFFNHNKFGVFTLSCHQIPKVTKCSEMHYDTRVWNAFHCDSNFPQSIFGILDCELCAPAKLRFSIDVIHYAACNIAFLRCAIVGFVYILRTISNIGIDRFGAHSIQHVKTRESGDNGKIAFTLTA